MKVLLSSASFLPAYGGPAYSVKSLASHLAARGIETAIWAPDGSARAGIGLGGEAAGAVGGLRALAGSLDAAVNEFGAPDLFHDSGLWWRHNRQIARMGRRLGVPVVVSIRGMLEPAALRHRAWRKRVAWWLYQRANLERAAALHVTSDLEAGNVRALGLRPEIVCIPNGLTVPPEFPSRDPGRPRMIAFMGRLHPIKGLPLLLEAWSRIRPPEWSLQIAGPDEIGHRKSLEAMVRERGLGGSVTFTGPLDGERKRDFFRRAWLFVLPSYSENFGLAAGEALAQGLPVIATKGTPWEILETERCGWRVDTSVDGLERGLRAAIATLPDELANMGKRGHAYVARNFSWASVATEMAALYERIGGASA